MTTFAQEFRMKIAMRAFNAAQAVMERQLTGRFQEAAREEWERAREKWLELQSVPDNEALWKAWLTEERKTKTALDESEEPAATKPAKDEGVDDNGWSPIETAPKDGTMVDLWHPESGRAAECCWSAEPNDAAKGEWVQEEVPGGGVAQFTPGWAPTHWRHVPKDPVGATIVSPRAN